MLFPSTVAGSLPKPSWLAEPNKLWPQWRLQGDELAAAKLDATLLALKWQEDADIDIVCDGEMSRLTFRGSLTGEWLDTVGDDLTNYGFFTGAALGLFTTTHNPLYLAAGAVTVISGLIGSGLEYRYLIKIGSGDLLKYPLSQGQGTGKLSFIQPLFKRDTFVFLTLCAAALGCVGPMLCVFAAGAVGVLIAVLRTELRLSREGQKAEAAR